MNDGQSRRLSCGMRTKSLSYCSMILLLVFLVENCSSLPLFLVMSGKGKCVIVQAAEATILKVNYEAPGVFWIVLLYRMFICCVCISNGHPRPLQISL